MEKRDLYDKNRNKLGSSINKIMIFQMDVISWLL